MAPTMGFAPPPPILAGRRHVSGLCPLPTLMPCGLVELIVVSSRCGKSVQTLFRVGDP